MSREINDAGINLIKSFESLRLAPYLDIVGVATIGYGATYYEDKTKVSLNDSPIAEDRAIELLKNTLSEHEKYVENYVTAAINNNEFAALVSFCFNVGPGQLHGSTLLTMLNAGQDRVAVADQFLRWNKAGGKELPGLTRRRQAERSLFLHPVIPASPGNDDTDVQL